jgi:hypothetical protein
MKFNKSHSPTSLTPAINKCFSSHFKTPNCKYVISKKRKLFPQSKRKTFPILQIKQSNINFPNIYWKFKQKICVNTKFSPILFLFFLFLGKVFNLKISSAWKILQFYYFYWFLVYGEKRFSYFSGFYFLLELKVGN